MKKLFLILLIGLSLLTSCKKENIKPNPTPIETIDTLNSTIKIQVGGTSVDTLICQVYNINQLDSTYQVYYDSIYPNEYNDGNTKIAFKLLKNNEYRIFIGTGNYDASANFSSIIYCNDEYIMSGSGIYHFDYFVN